MHENEHPSIILSNLLITNTYQTMFELAELKLYITHLRERNYQITNYILFSHYDKKNRSYISNDFSHKFGEFCVYLVYRL